MRITPTTIALASAAATLLIIGLALVFYGRRRMRRLRLVPLHPMEGPTRPFPQHLGHPGRFRGVRNYRATGRGRPEPHRHRDG